MPASLERIKGKRRTKVSNESSFLQEHSDAET